MSDSSKLILHGFRNEQKLVLERELLSNLKTYADELKVVWDTVSGKGYEDTVYRFYHYSFKVYLDAPYKIQMIVEILKRLAPSGTKLAPLFEEICQAGLQPIAFEGSHNEAWGQYTRPFIDAFFHARYFLEMAIKYGEILDEPPSALPSGWAALLSLYEIR